MDDIDASRCKATENGTEKNHLVILILKTTKDLSLILTRATVRLGRLKNFWANVDAVSRFDAKGPWYIYVLGDWGTTYLRAGDLLSLGDENARRLPMADQRTYRSNKENKRLKAGIAKNFLRDLSPLQAWHGTIDLSAVSLI